MLRKKFVAVDIGNKNIKIVYGGMNKSSVIIDEYDIVETPQNTIKDGKITNLKPIVGLISEALKRNRIPRRNLVLSITGTAVITRDIQIPKSTDEEIEKMLEFEAQQYFPVDLGNYVLDFKVLEDVKQEEIISSRVLLVAVPSKQVEEYMKLPQLLKMNISAIDLPANCISKYIFPGQFLKGEEKVNGDMPKEFAVLDIGAETIGVCIFSNARLKFNRILLNGSREMDKLISGEYSIDYKEAEKIKFSLDITEKGITEQNDKGTKNEHAVELIKPVISNFADDVNRFMEFYNSRGSGNRVNKIYLCGGGSKLKGLDGNLNTYFNLPVEHLKIENNVQYKGKKSQEQFRFDVTYLINAIGAVIRN